MNGFLEMVLDSINDRIERVLRKAFKAGQEHERGNGPGFEVWLYDEKRRAKGE